MSRDQIHEAELRAAGFEPRPYTLQCSEVLTTEGVVFEPWTDGYAVGFKVSYPDRPTTYVYLNPSGETDTHDVNDSDVFVYRGLGGHPKVDEPRIHINIWEKEEEK
jgi:hypothetical protein